LRSIYWIGSLIASVVVLAPGGAARAQNPPKDPKFEFAKAEEVEDVRVLECKASAQAGLIITTGNTRTRTVSGGAKASCKSGNNKLQAELGGAYADSRVYLVDDGNANGVIDPGEVMLGQTDITSQSWALKARYDRFLTERNALYLSALMSADRPAGKELVGGAQAGYSRLLYKSERHELVAESGYDFSYEDPVVGGGVAIHSGRLFAGYEGKLSADTGVSGAVELLANMNPLATAAGEVAAFEDTRVNATAALTTTLYRKISFRFAVTAKYDNAPSPRPFKLPYADGFIILADELDTRTEATLIINFL
jgi:hypothetical protein